MATESSSPNPQTNAPTDPSTPQPGSPAEREFVLMPLIDLEVGARGEFLTCSLAKCDRQLLNALGFGERCKFRLCQARDPFIVQVRGTRIGISRDVAKHLMVAREGEVRAQPVGDASALRQPLG